MDEETADPPGTRGIPLVLPAWCLGGTIKNGFRFVLGLAACVQVLSLGDKIGLNLKASTSTSSPALSSVDRLGQKQKKLSNWVGGSTATELARSITVERMRILEKEMVCCYLPVPEWRYALFTGVHSPLQPVTILCDPIQALPICSHY